MPPTIRSVASVPPFRSVPPSPLCAKLSTTTTTINTTTPTSTPTRNLTRTSTTATAISPPPSTSTSPSTATSTSTSIPPRTAHNPYTPAAPPPPRPARTRVRARTRTRAQPVHVIQPSRPIVHIPPSLTVAHLTLPAPQQRRASAVTTVLAPRLAAARFRAMFRPKSPRPASALRDAASRRLPSPSRERICDRERNTDRDRHRDQDRQRDRDRHYNHNRDRFNSRDRDRDRNRDRYHEPASASSAPVPTKPTPRNRIPWRRAKSGADNSIQTSSTVAPESLRSESVSDESLVALAPVTTAASAVPSASSVPRPGTLSRISAIFRESDGRLEENLKSMKRRVVQVRRQPDDAPVRFHMGFRSRTGWEPIRATKENQDCLVALVPWGPDSRYNLFAALDGHGRYGHQCAMFIAQRVVSFLSRLLRPEGERQHIVNTLHRAIAYAERRLESPKTDIDFQLSGSTGVFVLVHGATLFCANVGDSRAIIGRESDVKSRRSSASHQGDPDRDMHSDGTTTPLLYSAKQSPRSPPKSPSRASIKRDAADPATAQLHRFSPVPVSIDQKPRRPDEKVRLQAAGARVDAWEGIDVGEERVWLPEMRTPGLAVSRSFGDLLVKDYGVNCVPEVYTLDLCEDDRFMVIATDGVFEFMSSAEVVDVVGRWRDFGTAQEAAEELVKIATERWILDDSVIDDISCVVVFMNVLTAVSGPQQAEFVPSTLRPKAEKSDVGSARAPRNMTQSKSHQEGLHSSSETSPLSKQMRKQANSLEETEDGFFENEDIESL